jgi:YidC/Oxa1 family membrane protein insertase
MVIFLAVNFLFQSCFKQENPLVSPTGITFTTSKQDFSRTSIVSINVINNSASTITIKNECPNEPGKDLKFENNAWIEKAVSPELNCPNAKDIVIAPQKKELITYESWSHALFGDMGRFKIEFTAKVGDKDQVFTTNEFTVSEEGILTKLWDGVLYRPIYNALIFLMAMIPGHDLGLAIIILTLIIRTILLIPSQKAMKAQKRLQSINPRLEKIKQQYKGDQQKIASETMAIWKEAKVNPLSSCLPILLQLPILIAVYQTIRNGLNPDNTYLLYTTYANFSLSDINTNFLGILDLTKVNTYVLPLIIGGLQFAQIKLSMAHTAKKATNQKDGEKPKNEMAMANNMMLYMMPVMIAVFTASVPAGLAVYWGISTIYGIVQQIFVNMDKSDKPDNEVKVRVIEKA